MSLVMDGSRDLLSKTCSLSNEGCLRNSDACFNYKDLCQTRKWGVLEIVVPDLKL